MQLSFAIQQFLSASSAVGLAPATIATYQRTLTGLTRAIGGHSRLDRINLDEVLHWLKSRQLSNVTLRKEITILKRFSKWLLRRSATQNDLFLTLSIPRAESPLRQGFTASELRTLFVTMSQSNCSLALRDFLLFRLIAVTGLRRAEALSLKWENLDLENRTLQFSDCKSKRCRRVLLPMDLLPLLSRMSCSAASPWLVPGRHPSLPLSCRQANERLRFWLSQSGIQRRCSGFQGFRVWFAGRAYQISNDVVLVSRLLGHRDLRPTLRYIGSASPQVDSMVAKISASLHANQHYAAL